MDLSNLNDDYITVIPSIRGISVFDSLNYDYYDLEVLGPAQRRYLIEKTKRLEFKQTSGKWLTHVNGESIYFPPHKLFNRNFKSFLPKEPKENSWLALTPTQAAFLLFQSQEFDEQNLLQLMMRHPFNLKRLGAVLEHESSFGYFNQLLPELMRLFSRAQVMFKNKVPLDKL